MMREITIGQYYKANSILHRLDPRVKILGTLLYMIVLFVFKSVIAYAFATVVLATIILISKVPFKFILRGLKTILILLIFTVVCQLFMTKGENIVFTVYKLKVYDKGLYNAIMLGLRIILLIIGSSMMTYTTTPNELTDGFESVMKPLKIVKFPVHDIAMMMSIALRYIPILVEEADKIMKAQMARGADFESGNIFKKIHNIIPLIVPLFVAAFRRASELALAMEARCYNGGEGRTKMKPLRYKMKDIFAYILMLLFIGVNVLFMIMKIHII